MPYIQTRKTKWGQFLTLVVGILCFFVANTAWWVGHDDDGNDVYTWKAQVAGVVIGIVVCLALIIIAYYFLLYWKVTWEADLLR